MITQVQEARMNLDELKERSQELLRPKKNSKFDFEGRLDEAKKRLATERKQAEGRIEMHYLDTSVNLYRDRVMCGYYDNPSTL